MANRTSRATPAGPVPSSLLEDDALNAAVAAYLPSNYNFEIHKTIHHVRHYASACIALQMPEGLTLWATAISDIIERFTDATTVIMGDVTYGACCVDDFTARALGADMLVHYGHSCLVPVDQTSIRTLYVFVEIAIDAAHVCATIRSNFPSNQQDFHAQIVEDADEEQRRAKLLIEVEDENILCTPNASQVSRPTHLVLVATVQFINALQGIKSQLEQNVSKDEFYDVGSSGIEGFRSESARIQSNIADGRTETGSSVSATQTWYASNYRVTIPQVKPLSPGEILGCTSPKLPADVENSVDGIIYLGDGRFHLESIMIANPRLPAFRYDPYEKRFVREGYDHALMRSNRANAVQEAKRSLTISKASASLNGASRQGGQTGWGLVLGTLGRQGSTRVLSHLQSMLAPKGVESVPILLSELSPQKLALFGNSLTTFIQTSCPRLSIDWGDAFGKPLLSPYEAAVALENASGWQATTIKGSPRRSDLTHVGIQTEHEGDYPMDFYADDSLGPWTPRHGQGVRKVNAKGVSNRELLKRGGRRRAAAAAAAAASTEK